MAKFTDEELQAMPDYVIRYLAPMQCMEEVRAEAARRQRLSEKMKEALAVIGFPRRGTEEEDMDRYDMAKYVQDNFTRKDLGIE